MKELKVKNMHCESCAKIIQMELEESGYINKIISVELTNPQNNIGVVKFKDLDQNEIEKAKAVIQKAGEYVVLN
ncbi:hypothetical protein A2X44_02520 [candidate division CPR3 bacterium GWF2_35_18]|uniref:HMA domain-containing protein n=1 Tax=candidate division CPR3 bacterium GW2011_GWF2_35_18 TaxID=1618350 RepID=A0A0G0E3Z0_UNCC3|nr:MAG: hypothetical protein UR67_C0002G0185 [candidate division CPR3 bacterium GW2011_GWF2_35_18]OGB62868.1 MAG: hypothetical protein A2X44_02520 [candidate division CPR3 bacterium GWF2_35_18]OGB65449.1 MAG: hypothetical protein A2250_00735 [candidate division CPR3 bacterium RIFOXYA2_FULL_35_13]OGB75868.1 MAG: hypothetical protein A2476_03160 [candidate division CPR3 bacterium RIFOXYC2_FULL_35_7]OGB78907.1 MAG: hypothetical protein A2296_04255 [candidate division CPR3 bacterium RIFOXYB2_FULL_3